MEKDRLGFPWLTHSRGSIIFLAKQSQGRKSSPALGAPQETCSWEGALLSPLAPSWPAEVLAGETEATQKWARLPAPLFWPAWDQKLCCCIWGRQHQEGGWKVLPTPPTPEQPLVGANLQSSEQSHCHPRRRYVPHRHRLKMPWKELPHVGRSCSSDSYLSLLVSGWNLWQTIWLCTIMELKKQLAGQILLPRAIY